MKSVLIVDDSRVMRQLVRRSLRQAGFKPKKVHEAEHGRDALDQIEGGLRPSVILCDWNMPEMNGITFLRELRRAEYRTPFGFVTSESTADMRAEAVAAGASFLLTKPFTAADVRHAMQTAGFRPNSGMRGGSERTTIHQQGFGPQLITQVVGQLVNQPLMIRNGPAFPASAKPAMTCTWITQQDDLLYVGLCELQLAAALGAAIGMRPPTAVQGFIADGGIPADLRADSREVFNVLSRAFTDAGSVHVRLDKIAFSPDPPLPEVMELNRNPPSRKDYKISVGRFGAGRLAIVSTAPGFVKYAPTVA
ncbi:MAG: response regulator [Myxococcales bacterium]|nr:response regulator [Myxococcales bacterium]